MKINTNLLALFLLVILLQAQDINPNYSYDDFCRQFGRTYEGEEKVLHEKIFNTNYAQLLKDISEKKDLQVSTFLDWNQTQISNYLNYREEDNKAALSSRKRRNITNLFTGYYTAPKTFDWRALGKVTPVKNQGACGSCWVFVATAQLQSAIAIATNGSLVDLSQQYPLQCIKYLNGGGCNGGYSISVLDQFYNNGGLPLQNQYPYKQNSTYYQKNNISICSQTNKFKIPNKKLDRMYTFNLTNQQLEEDLINNGPLAVTVVASYSFFGVGTSGIVNCSRTVNLSTDHYVLLVGYTQTHWIIKNSWGSSWGQNGYGYINKTQGNNCKMGSRVQYYVWDFGFDIAPLPPNPIPPPLPVNGTVNYRIRLLGQPNWRGTILGIRQNNKVVATFGDGFNYSQTIIVPLLANYTALVVPVVYATPYPVDFILIAPNGSEVLRWYYNNYFDSTKIIKVFCPTQSCVDSSPNATYYLTFVDPKPQGWNSELYFYQAGRANQRFTLNANDNRGGLSFTFSKYDPVRIYLYRLKNSTISTSFAECKFILKTFDGLIVLNKSLGFPNAQSNSIFEIFTPGFINLSPVTFVTPTQVDGEQSSESGSVGSGQNKVDPYKVSTFVLIPFVVISVGLAVYFFMRLKKKSSEWLNDKYSGKEVESAKNIETGAR